MKRLFFSIITGLILTLSVTSVLALTDEEIAKNYAISFPIAELGNCQNLNECQIYCEDIQNEDACIDYAKRHGFYEEHPKYQESDILKSDEEILKLAKEELGCSTYDECMNFCEEEGNWGKCEEFAYRHGFGGEEMQKMREAMDKLGCDSPSSCMTFCSSPDNMQECMEVFESLGFSSNITPISLEECRNLNPDPSWECEIEDDVCICTEPPEVWCPKATSEDETCVWDGSTCTCWNPKDCESYPGCKFTGSSCECSFQEEPPEVWCTRNPGCGWDGEQCICTGEETEIPPSDYQPEEPGEIWCPRTPGCSWTGTECLCTPTEEPLSPEPSPQVQGISTSSLWDEIVKFFLGNN